jgi:hypothetical protein
VISIFKKNINLKQQLVLLLIGSFCFLNIGCHDEAALKQALIDKTIRERIETHKRKKRVACHRKSLKLALELADSLIIQSALTLVDTSAKLNRPIKPKRPAIDLPVDTTPIEPLFIDTIESSLR